MKKRRILIANNLQQRNAYRDKLETAKENINRVEDIVQTKVRTALASEREEMEHIKRDRDDLQRKNEILMQTNETLNYTNKSLEEDLQNLRQQLDAFNTTSDVKELLRRLDMIRAEKEQEVNKHTKVMEEYNRLSMVVEDLTNENRALREMAEVPANFGIKIENIKLLNKEKIEDYRKLVKVLQEDNYKLEEERAKLKHELKILFMTKNSGDPKEWLKLLTKDQLDSVH